MASAWRSAAPYEVAFWSLPLDGTAAPVLRATVPQLFPGAPAWDWDHQRVVYEQAGGARNALHVHDAHGDKLVNAAHRLNGFDLPRFVRGDEKQISAFLDLLPGHRLVVFPDVGAKYRAVTDCTAAVLLKRDGGFVLVSKTDLEGPMKGSNVFPGVFHHAWLKSDFSPDGPTSHQAAVTIYELDAVLIDGNLIAWLTTDTGALMIAGASKPAGIERMRTRVVAVAPTPSWPAVCARAGEVAFALVAAAGTPAAEVQVARAPVAALLK
ncbi:MAG: hypothetical protein E6J91_08405 [Deltaproteobacteria bacterium]|nr:MAG: hypothetical protein E6J91_08405 [Deltaproteobacteria bacterium]